jgi:hypothetical protein
MTQQRMVSYWSGSRLVALTADVAVATPVMLLVGLIGIWLGTLAAVLATVGLATVGYMRHSRVMALGGQQARYLKRSGS